MSFITDLLGGDQSYSTSTEVARPSDLIPQPDLKAFDKRTAKRLYKKWLESNRNIAILNNMDRIAEAIAFTALFAGQMGYYSQLDIFKISVWEEVVDVPGYFDDQGRWVPPQKTGRYVEKPNWGAIGSLSAIITALTYLCKNNPAGIGIPITALLSTLGIEGITKLLGF